MAEGDLRVLLVMNAVLSAALGAVVVWGLAFVDVLVFSFETVGLVTVALFALTYLAILR